ERVRAYFAVVERATSSPTIFDAARDGAFSLDTPPTGWLNAGWVSNFTRGAGSASAAVIGDAHNDFAAQLAQSGATPTTDTRVALDFRYWGKLQMAISGVSQSFNLLAEQAGAMSRPSGGAAVT